MHALTVMSVTVAIMASTCGVLSAETASSPQYATYATWEPYSIGKNSKEGSNLGDVGFDSLKPEIDATEVHSQGYTLIKRYRTGVLATTAGDCTRAAWDALPSQVGVVLFVTHGNPRFIDAFVASTMEAANEWMDSGIDSADMEVRFSKQHDCWNVLVHPAWFKRNFASFFTNNASIVYFSTCHSGSFLVDRGEQVFQSVGGNVAIGYDDEVTNTRAALDISHMFQSMNGTRPDNLGGQWRLASIATDQRVLYDIAFTRKIAHETTLCPAVAYPTLSNIAPQGSGTPASGAGKIIFDTSVDTVHVAATDALTFSVSGTVDITQVEWNGDHEIDFHWQAAPSSGAYGPPTFKVTVTAVAAKVLAFPGNQQLDGGDLSSDTSAPSAFAPNAVDFKWSFSN
jgi:hypothetical protein